MRILIVVLLAACAPRPYVPCNDTITCRDQGARREAAFAREVAKEPPVTRLDVEPVARVAFIDRTRGLVYALDPEFVALDLKSGAERWRAKGVSGDSLWRVGELLAVSREGAKLPPEVSFVDPQQAGKATHCTLNLGAPKEAERAQVHYFDRAGQPYAYWVSSWTYEGGTRPDERAEARQRNAKACGIVRLDPRSCGLSVEKLEDFESTVPQGSREQCTISPLLDLPAAAASSPTVKTGDTALRVITGHKEDETGCKDTTKLSLEAYDAAGAVLWTHGLEERTVDVCRRP